jgi:hypothetical protein
MHDPKQLQELRDQMIGHLEAAQAIADEAKDFGTRFIIETALDSARADQWPRFIDALKPKG